MTAEEKYELAVALVNWNNRAYLDRCLQSLAMAALPLSMEIVVADNGSTDGSLEMLAEHFPYVKVIQNGENAGVARGNNQCIRHTTAPYIYILNNDTVVNRPAIMRMVRFLAEHPQVGAVGGNLLNPDGTLQATFCTFPTLWEEFQLVTHLGVWRNPLFPSHPCVWPEARAVDWLSSASVVVRREAMAAIGLVDEDYFVYSDETDWQYRLWQAGWKIYYLPEVTTIHYGGGSFQPGGKRYTLVYRGRMLFAQKHYGRCYSVLQRALFALAALGRQAVWFALLPRKQWREVARRQIVADLQTLRLCLRLE